MAGEEDSLEVRNSYSIRDSKQRQLSLPVERYVCRYNSDCRCELKSGAAAAAAAAAAADMGWAWGGLFATGFASTVAAGEGAILEMSILESIGVAVS